MSEHSKANRERFNAVARSWDEGPVRTPLAQAVAGAIQETLALRGDERAMELGAGTGLVTALLAPSLGHVLAVDSSAGMLSVLREKAQQLGLENVHALEADLSQSIPAGPFDLVFSSMTLHHIEDVPGLLKRLAGSLASGGHLALADLTQEDGSFHGDMAGIAHQGFEPETFKRWLRETGLVEVQLRQAHVVEKPDATGSLRRYPVFLATARKPQS